MASAKNKNETTTADTTTTEQQVAPKRLSVAEMLPDQSMGVTEQDMVLSGQLMPMYIGNIALAKGFAPVAGLLDRVECLPPQKRSREDEDDWVPFNLIVRELKFATTGTRGNWEKRQEVAVDVGGSILIAVTGQHIVNKELMAAIRDPEYLYWITAQAIGTKKVNSLNPMVDWEIYVAKTKIKRADKGAQWALPPWYNIVNIRGDLTASIRNKEPLGLLKVHLEDGLDVNPAGIISNRATGEVLARLSAAGQVLPPPPELSSPAKDVVPAQPS